MNARRPAPLYDTESRPKCPVCGHVTYSRAGVHPQCARQKADDERMVAEKSKQSTAPVKTKAVSPDAVKPWHRRCPKCKTEVHIRRTNCDCGHRFAKRPTG